jgi:lysophospholipase L1-like esterase
MPNLTYRFFLLGLSILAVGCSHLKHHDGASQLTKGESVVLAGEQPAHLAFPAARPFQIQVRSTYLPALPQTVVYENGKDYVIDYDKGEIRRTSQSRIPDYRTNSLYEVKDFDHSKYPGFGNSGFFAFVDYAARRTNAWPVQKNQVAFLPQTLKRLQAGTALKIVAFGDSITAGGDATTTNLVFWKRWADALQAKYPKAKVEAINGATGGDRTAEGLVRLEAKVLKAKPDLVLLGFGMNDHNIGGFGTTLETFRANLQSLITRIRKETGAEVVLYSAFPPNPNWHYGSHNMEAYALATEEVARQNHCAYADVYHNWVAYNAAKKPEDVLGNNINHPNDFGHWLYFQVLRAMGL